MPNHDRIDRRFWLIDADGRRLYPVRIRNRATGRAAFRIAPGSTNITARQTELEDIFDVVRAVVEMGHGVRVTAGQGEQENIRSLGGRVQGYGMDDWLRIRIEAI